MKNRAKSIGIAALSVLACYPAAQAAVLANYSFTNSANGTYTNIAADSSAAGVTASALSNSGLSNGAAGAPGVVSSLSVLTTQPNATNNSPGGYAFDGKGFEVQMNLVANSASPTAGDEYLQFSVQAQAGQLKFTSLSLDFGNENALTTSPATRVNFNLYASTTGNSTAEYVLVNPSVAFVFGPATDANGSYRIESQTINIAANAAFDTETFTGPVYFRLAFADADSSSASKWIFIDNITLNGEVTAVPEPGSGTLALGCLALAASLARRRRS